MRFLSLPIPWWAPLVTSRRSCSTVGSKWSEDFPFPPSLSLDQQVSWYPLQESALRARSCPLFHRSWGLLGQGRPPQDSSLLLKQQPGCWALSTKPSPQTQLLLGIENHGPRERPHFPRQLREKRGASGEAAPAALVFATLVRKCRLLLGLHI